MEHPLGIRDLLGRPLDLADLVVNVGLRLLVVHFQGRMRRRTTPRRGSGRVIRGSRIGLRGRPGSRNRRVGATDIPGIRDVRVGRVAAHLLVRAGQQHIRALGRQLQTLRTLLRGALLFGSCLAASFFITGFFGAGFEETDTFFAFRVGFGGAGVFAFTFAFTLAAFTLGFLEAGVFFASFACFAEAGGSFAFSVASAGFLEADAPFATSGSPECFLEAGAGGFSSVSLGVGASAWCLAEPAAPRAMGAVRTMICVSVVMPVGRSGARGCSEERELPNEAVLVFPLDSPLGKVLPVWVREGVMGPGLASDLFKENGCSLVWTTPAGVAHKD
ncbi:hypothetical protein PF003_g40601 [Phytophthora fragariae]|nr:hypothetical protein PF003_g40601 [Phytophthora fragariae]